MRRRMPRSDSIILTISSSLEMKGGAMAIVSAVKRSSNPHSTIFRPDGQPTDHWRFNVAYADDERLYTFLRNLSR